MTKTADQARNTSSAVARSRGIGTADDVFGSSRMTTALEALARLSRQEPTPEYFIAFQEEINAEKNDRGAAILLVCNVEICLRALMRNGRDRRLGEPVMGHAILERVLLFGTRSADYIRASGHNGCIATEVTLQATTEAEYMTAPERFADSQIPLAPRAPSIHDP
jgi:hypothetical protein